MPQQATKTPALIILNAIIGVLEGLAIAWRIGPFSWKLGPTFLDVTLLSLSLVLCFLGALFWIVSLIILKREEMMGFVIYGALSPFLITLWFFSIDMVFDLVYYLVVGLIAGTCSFYAKEATKIKEQTAPGPGQ